ncbi:MAG: hypothetical protein CBE00_06875 [Planctomycetaceae bacterium TMED240]|nr:hypothetical protein [Rhodopirellula sp.]OUX06726.1 MAG: hypothetical protein CBE00_06875 [Planctomycetaceae bacterium TMED240]
MQTVIWLILGQAGGRSAKTFPDPNKRSRSLGRVGVMSVTPTMLPIAQQLTQAGNFGDVFFIKRGVSAGSS